MVSSIISGRLGARVITGIISGPRTNVTEVSVQAIYLVPYSLGYLCELPWHFGESHFQDDIFHQRSDYEQLLELPEIINGHAIE